jgi:hypothetical protein
MIMVDTSRVGSVEINQLTTGVPNRVAQQFAGFVKRLVYEFALDF